MDRRRPSRVFLRVFSTFGLVFAIVLAALGTWSVADELRGSAAPAEVLDVDDRGGRTFLTVRFTTERGDVCESRLRVTVGDNRDVRAGERIQVHHAKTDPCLRVREAGDQSGWLIMAIAPVFVIAFAIMSYVAWRRPRPPLPLR